MTVAISYCIQDYCLIKSGIIKDRSLEIPFHPGGIFTEIQKSHIERGNGIANRFQKIFNILKRTNSNNKKAMVVRINSKVCIKDYPGLRLGNN